MTKSDQETVAPMIGEKWSIMRIAVILLRWVLGFIYFFMKLMPTDNSRIVFLSRQSDTPSEDFVSLSARIKEFKPDVKIVMITQRADNNIKSMLSFAGATLRSMHHLARARVCVLDSYWPAVSVLKHKKQLAVIQMWHAMGKIKKSGYQSLGKKFGRNEMIAEEMRMHRNYDVVIAGGKAFNPFYCASFGIEENILYNVGLPRMDDLRENVESSKELFYSAYPEFKGKRIVLYAPTFRKGKVLNPTPLVKAFSAYEDTVLVVKLHPNQIKSKTQIAAVECPEIPTSAVLSVAECVITDYSAISIEAAVLDKPVYFYLFDYDDYLSHNGLNVILPDELPSCVYTSAKALGRAIAGGSYDRAAYEGFREKYLPDMSGRATDKIANLIISCMENDKHDAICKSLSGMADDGGKVGSEDTVCTGSL